MEAVLFKPRVATRVRYNMNTDTPLPPDEPGGENPPDGAVIDYLLKADAAGPVTLEIVDGAGRTVRRHSSRDVIELPTPETAPVPLYWYRRPLKLHTTAGMHRFLWDLRYQPIEGGGGRGGRGGLPISATPYNTVPTPNSIWAPAGPYTVRLTVDGKAFEQPLTLRLDPRVKAPTEGLRRQAEDSLAMYDGILAAQDALQKLRALRGLVKTAQEAAGKAASPASVTEALAAFDKKAADLEGIAAREGQAEENGIGPDPGDRLEEVRAVLDGEQPEFGLRKGELDGLLNRRARVGHDDSVRHVNPQKIFRNPRE
jgi:hypothetical protein